MKLLSIALVLAGCISAASATTIIASGGLDGFQFGYTTSLSSPIATPFTRTGESMATIAVGSIQGNLFSEFAPSDTSPPAFGDSGLLVGKWLGSASDNSSAADAFSGLQIWFRVTTVIGGQTYTGYFSDAGLLFPTNDGGVADDQTVASYNLDAISPISTGNWQIDSGNGRVTLVIPEPSTSLLGALGALCVLRRRR